MNKITINRGDNTLLAPNFRASEFYSSSPNPPASHDFYMELVEAASFLRNHFNTPWRITSTMRTHAHEVKICADFNLPPGLAWTSKHVLAPAFDSQPAGTAARNAEIMATLAEDFTNNGEIFQKLRTLGIKGFGLYDTFIHLDVRVGPCIHKDRFGAFACWDERHNAPKKKAVGAGTWKPTLHNTLKVEGLLKRTSLAF